MQRTIDETDRRLVIQMAYNEERGITPKTVFKSKEEILNQRSILDVRGKATQAYIEPENVTVAADPLVSYMTRDQLEKLANETERKMKQAAKELDFITAAQMRDELFALREKLKTV